jgi:predicted RNA-binding protein YlqC (UPF0109 family)
MDLVDLTKYLVTNLVKNTDSVSVTLSDGEEKVIEVVVAEDDIGAVIGRGGKIANSIRNIVQASAYINNLGRVKVNISAK